MPHLSYVNVFAKDVVALSGFYQRVFGFPEIEAIRSPIFRGLDTGKSSLGFNALDAYGLLQLAEFSDTRGVKFLLNIDVDSETEVDRMVPVAVAAGATLIKAPYLTYYNWYQSVLLDPEGNVFRINFTHATTSDTASSSESEPSTDQAVTALAAQARAELAMLAYPDRAWVQPAVPTEGTQVHDVLIIGGGQSGLATCAMLKAQGVSNVAVLDRASAGGEGVWETFARMPELRTPKHLNGMDLGLPSLSVQHWYAARFGADAWQGIDRIPRTRWMDYLRWYRATLALPVENEVEVRDVRPASQPGLLEIETFSEGRRQVRFARQVVLATGSDGAGAWRVPDFIASALPAARCHHSSDLIDFSALQGQRIGILGHGASAFDNAVAALQAGAQSVDLCFRRKQLPRVNPHRHIETAGLMTHYARLGDATRWQVARHFRAVDQPPPRGSFRRALDLPGFTLRAACGWQEVRWSDGEIVIDTPQGPLHFDHVICATGQAFDLAARPELGTLAPRVLRWHQRYTPPAAEASETLGAHPYLGEHYEFLPRQADDDWVSRVFAFNSASYVSQGPHSTSISGHKHALPRLVRGLTQRLFLDQEHALIDGLRRYAELELDLPDDFETSMAARTSRPTENA